MKVSPSTTDLARLLQCYFCSYLINQRHLSQHTIHSYRDTFRLLLPFVATQQNKPVYLLNLTDISSKVILSFLQHLERERGCKAKTRNSRLSAIRSFFNYVSVKEPQRLADTQSILAIPDKRTDRFIFEYLEKREIEAILATQEMTTWAGQRDHIMLLTLYNTGARVSEIAKLEVKDIDLKRQQAIRLHGKGRKERIIPLWPHTITELRKWLVNLPDSPNTPLFPNRNGEKISRFGVRQRLDCAVNKATATCPSLKGRKINLHCIRHTTAMHLLQSGVDLTVIALWLGHEKIETTHQYMEANLEMKRQALAKLPVLDGQNQTYEPSKDILAYLDSL